MFARIRLTLVLTLLAATGLSVSFASAASAAVPAWILDSLSQPANLPPGGSGTLVVTAGNIGAAEANGAGGTVTLVDHLPAGLVAKSASGSGGLLGIRGSLNCSVVSASLVECTFGGSLPPYEQLEVKIGVEVQAGAKSGEISEVTVAGGGAKQESLKRPVVISGAPVPFGVQNYSIEATNEDGTPVTQAGSHPFGLTTTFDFNRTAGGSLQPAVPKDLHFNLPPGLVGNPTVVPQCTDLQFYTYTKEGPNHCPADTVIGAADVQLEFGSLGNGGALVTFPTPVFNLAPHVGEPARFGFQAITVPVILDTSVRTGGDYGVTVSVNNIPQIVPLVGTQLTIWGVPGAAVHDPTRGWGCIAGGFFSHLSEISPCKPLELESPPPLLSLPTSCTGPLQSSVSADSWEQEGSFTAPVGSFFESALDGCNRLPFEASISVAPDSQNGSTPTGLTVGLHVPQTSTLNPEGLAQANVKNTTVTLPRGVALNASAADGLEACSEEQVALSADVEPSCPAGSKVGLVEIKTPLLPNPLTGAVYLAAQNANPFGSLVALYLVARDPVSGTLVKVAGEVKLDPVTGQLVSTFDNTPQLPFEDLSLSFFGGSRAPLGTPAGCGAYTTTASIAPWSGNAPAEASSTFDITSGPNGSACESPLLFDPSLTAGTTSIQAGGLTPFTMTVSRDDGQQNIGQFQLHMPPGLSGLLTGVELCGEAQADAGTCGPNSLIGETTVSVGLGGDPYSVKGGKVYITGPYEGAPFGISVAVPAKAGPYDLGMVVVRGRIEVDPTTSALTVTTNSPAQGYAIPHILDGIPLEIRHVNFVTTRSGFTFNPTNCDPMGVTGSISSVEGSSSAVSVPFQVTNCAVLGFKPQFSVSTSGKTSRANGASLRVRLAYPKAAFGSQANIGKVKVDLPKQLPSRLTTLQKACPDSTFNTNPAVCGAASRIGTAKATTPLIPVPLEGPVYFVSHGGAKFPELIVVLSGYGVTVQLHSETFIDKAGITSSTFRTIPDVPVDTFELTLPQGPGSALAANGDLCTAKGLRMPTTFVAQNGMTIHQSTPITVTGCPHKAKKAKKTSKHRKKK